MPEEPQTLIQVGVTNIRGLYFPVPLTYVRWVHVAPHQVAEATRAIVNAQHAWLN